MGSEKRPDPVLLLVGAFSRHEEARHWARERSIATWGPVALESDPLPFRDTDYYTASMGPELDMVFWAFEQLVDPALLPEVKRTTNTWEDAYKQESSHDEARPLNLDPGYLTDAKLVLASTKDHHHRIYLSDGIFAEVTLHYQKGAWQTRPWTYPNYARADYQKYLLKCREYYRGRKREILAT